MRKNALRDEKELSIATYNIYLSRNQKNIISNVIKMARQGIIVFCLQEVLKSDEQDFIIDILLKKLGKKWDAIYHLGDEGSYLDFGTCILYNKNYLKLEKQKKTTLPLLTSLGFHEWLFSELAGFRSTIPQRRAISGVFTHKDKKIVIASIHLDTAGGKNHRLKQLRFVLKEFFQERLTPYQIVCGDFNSFDLLKTGKEKKELQILFGKKFKDAAEKIGWSADLYRINIPKDFPFFVILIKFFNLHIRRKLDYIWVKNFDIKECKKIDMAGSDHLPVIATLII